MNNPEFGTAEQSQVIKAVSGWPLTTEQLHFLLQTKEGVPMAFTYVFKPICSPRFVSNTHIFREHAVSQNRSNGRKQSYNFRSVLNCRSSTILRRRHFR